PIQFLLQFSDQRGRRAVGGYCHWLFLDELRTKGRRNRRGGQAKALPASEGNVWRFVASWDYTPTEGEWLGDGTDKYACPTKINAALMPRAAPAPARGRARRAGSSHPAAAGPRRTYGESAGPGAAAPRPAALVPTGRGSCSGPHRRR